MPDLLMAGMQWLNGRHEAAVSQPIVYRRGKNSVNLNATVGNVNMNLAAEFGGTQLRTTDKDFILNDPTKLVICGEQTVPKVGDLIEMVENGNTSRYGVRPPSEGEPEYSWDDMRTSLRINTKFLKVTNGCPA
jgi:hypothetical protein